MAWGLGRVAGLEQPDRWGGLIDLPPALDDRAATRLCEVLAGCGEDQVAIRGHGDPGAAAGAGAGAAPSQAWVPGGTVLVTGGTGAGRRERGPVARGPGRAPGGAASRSGPAATGVAVMAALGRGGHRT